MPIAKDNYWDRGDQRGESTLDPAQYHDPSEEILPVSKTTTAGALPPGIWGARGTIIRRSTLGGAPLGFDPNGVSMRVNVDPDIPGQGFVIDPTSISEAMAATVVMEEGLGQAQTIEELRYRASNAMQRFAIAEKIAIAPDSRRLPRSAPLAMPGVYVVPEATQGGAQLPPQQQPSAGRSSQGIQTKHAVNHAQMAKHPQIHGFSPDRPQNISVQQQPEPQAPQPQYRPEPAPVAQKPASLFATMAPSQPTPVVVQAAQTPGAPTYKVTMEIKDSPVSMDTWYHDVIRNEQVLALCYDTRASGFSRSRLRAQPDDIAVHVAGSNSIYICTDPSISFVHGNDEIAVYLIKSEYPLPQKDAPPLPPRMPGPEWNV